MINRINSFISSVMVNAFIVAVLILTICAKFGPVWAIEKSDVGAASGDLGAYTSALELYHSDVGNYPTTEQGLSWLVSPEPKPQGWAGPYMAQLSTDPWGFGYRYESNGSEYTVSVAHARTSGIDIASFSSRAQRYEINHDSLAIWYESHPTSLSTARRWIKVLNISLPVLSLLTAVLALRFSTRPYVRRILWLLTILWLLPLIVHSCVSKLLS